MLIRYLSADKPITCHVCLNCPAFSICVCALSNACHCSVNTLIVYCSVLCKTKYHSDVKNQKLISK